MNNNTIKFIAAAGVASLLAGCGSSGGGGGTPAPSFAQLTADADALATANDFDRAAGEWDAGVVESVDVPNSGSANYAGNIGGDLGPSGEDLIGELTMTADFGTSAVTGSATNFQHETRGAYTGTLNMENTSTVIDGVVGPPAAQLSASMTGQLENNGVSQQTDILLDGTFTGGDTTTAPSAVGGYADGTVGGEVLTGSFIATKQP